MWQGNVGGPWGDGQGELEVEKFKICDLHEWYSQSTHKNKCFIKLGI